MTERLVALAIVLLAVACLALALGLLALAVLVRQRYGSFRDFLSTPEEIVDSLLVHQKVGARVEQVEYVILQDGPSPKAFLVVDHPETVAVGALLVGWLALVIRWGFNPVTAMLLTAWCVLAFGVVRNLLLNHYTRYVMTNFRVIRTQGILRRENFSIPWGRITDFAWDQSTLGRLLGYATIRLVTASEESGLKELKNLSDPEGFNAVFVRLIERRQGVIDIDAHEDLGWLQDVGRSDEWQDITAAQADRQVWRQRRSNLPSARSPRRRR